MPESTDDPLGPALERAFRHHAEAAPSAAGLADRIRQTRRRQMVRRVGVGAGAALAAATAIVVPAILAGSSAEGPLGDRGPAGPGVAQPGGPAVVGPSSEEPSQAGLPPAVPADEGWRWESYGGVELQVPLEWTFGATGYPWCASGPDYDGAGYVGRPTGLIPLVLCNEEVAPVGSRAPYVWFDRAEPPLDAGGGWHRDSFAVGSVDITLFVDDPVVRDRIRGSARVVAAHDTKGCAPDHPLADDPRYRPEAWDVSAGEPVLDGTVCRYRFRDEDRFPGDAAPLLASERLSADLAEAVLAAAASSPVGGGPNDASSCVPDAARGAEAALLQLETESGVRELVVRYDGCDFHGLDDGTTERQLTADLVRAVFRPPVLPESYSGSLSDLFTPLWQQAAVTVR